MCIHYNLRLLHFLITKDLGVWWKNHFTHKHIILITPQAFFLWFENIVISNCNECKLLTFTQKSRRAFEHAHAQRLVFLWLSLLKFFFFKNMRLWVKAYSLLFFDYNCKDKHLIHGPRGLDKDPMSPKQWIC